MCPLYLKKLKILNGKQLGSVSSRIHTYTVKTPVLTKQDETELSFCVCIYSKIKILTKLEFQRATAGHKGDSWEKFAQTIVEINETSDHTNQQALPMLPQGLLRGLAWPDHHPRLSTPQVGQLLLVIRLV